jgi:hypothetical protein
VVDAGSARNDDGAGAVLQQPGKRDLRRCGPALTGDAHQAVVAGQPSTAERIPGTISG